MSGHVSVLLGETIEQLKLKPGMTIIDGTAGGGGHSEAILQKILPGGRLIAIDRDADAIERVGQRLAPYRDSVTLVHGDFKDIKAIMSQTEVFTADGAVLDLGVSSFQLDEPTRGFSYNNDARLDMRMDRSEKLTAYDVVNGYEESKLARVIAKYGEERWAARIAAFIVAERAKEPIQTTFELNRVIKDAIPAGARESGPHPAKRTFQAIRIEVNGELGGLDTAVCDFASVLGTGARLCVITFHSLEDRLVKQAMRYLEQPCRCPKELPCVCGKTKKATVVTRKPICPSAEEVAENPRSRSAKLRVCETVRCGSV